MPRSGYLFAFLSSAPAQAMIRQRTYGSVVQHIEPHHLRRPAGTVPDEACRARSTASRGVRRPPAPRQSRLLG